MEQGIDFTAEGTQIEVRGFVFDPFDQADAVGFFAGVFEDAEALLAEGEDFHPIVGEALELDNFGTAANVAGLIGFLIPHQNAKSPIAFEHRVHHNPVAIFKNMQGQGPPWKQHHTGQGKDRHFPDSDRRKGHGEFREAG